MDSRVFYKDLPILITGGLGFLGSNIAHKLTDLGADVSIIDNYMPGHGANPENISGIDDRVAVNLCDIRDEHAMAKLVRGKKLIFHVAGQTSHTDSMIDPFLDIDINCRGNMVFLEAVRRNSPDARIVYCSTRAIYGAPVSVPVTEDVRPNPVDIYGVNKYAGEAYHTIYHRAHGLDVVILRCSNSYGPRAQIEHPKFGILNWFVGLVLRGEKIKIFGDGTQLRDYTYVDDTVEAFIKAGMSQKANGNVYNVASPGGIQFIDMVKTLLRVSGMGEYELVPWPEDYKKIEVGDFAADCSMIEEDLGWKCTTDFNEGIKKTFDYYERHRAAYLPDDVTAEDEVEESSNEPSRSKLLKSVPA